MCCPQFNGWRIAKFPLRKASHSHRGLQIPNYPSNGCSNSFSLPQTTTKPRSQTDALPCSRNFLLLGNEETNNDLVSLQDCIINDHECLLAGGSSNSFDSLNTLDDVTDGWLFHNWIRNPKFRDRRTPSTATSRQYECPSLTRFNSVWFADPR